MPKSTAKDLHGNDATILARGEYHRCLEELDVATSIRDDAKNKRELAEDDLEVATTHATRLDDSDPNEGIVRVARLLRDALQAEKAAKKNLADARKELKAARSAYLAVR